MGMPTFFFERGFKLRQRWLAYNWPHKLPRGPKRKYPPAHRLWVMKNLSRPLMRRMHFRRAISDSYAFVMVQYEQQKGLK